jgi:hypothetical protein
MSAFLLLRNKFPVPGSVALMRANNLSKIAQRGQPLRIFFRLRGSGRHFGPGIGSARRAGAPARASLSKPTPNFVPGSSRQSIGVGALDAPAGGHLPLPLCALAPQPGARSALAFIDEDDTGRFERVLNHFDGAGLQQGPALEVRHRVRRHSGHIREFSPAPSEDSPREETLHRDNLSHGTKIITE